MNRKNLKYLAAMAAAGADTAALERAALELSGPQGHGMRIDVAGHKADSLYAALRSQHPFSSGEPLRPAVCARTLDELLERDKQREVDGFPTKIRVGRLIRPVRGGKDKIVVVPTTAEEKLVHGAIPSPPGDGSQTAGSGSGEEGEVIGEAPVHDSQGEGEGAGPGQGGGENHETESTAYDLGRVLTEKFQLPNIQDKGKRSAIARYTYDLTDKNRGFGQVLDKKATLRRIVETNLALGTITTLDNIDPSRMIVQPRDRVYQILSREKDYESQAMVFFLRDYSGSMDGKATELVCAQHVMIYSWLMYQYAGLVKTRFILHDTDAKEVPDFYTYHNLRVAGGTQVASAFRLVNRLIEESNLDKDYNIYVFHGTDGDDFDNDGSQSIPEIRKLAGYANRIGITVAEHSSGVGRHTTMHQYINSSNLLTAMPDKVRLDAMSEDSDEARMIEGIKSLIS